VFAFVHHPEKDIAACTTRSPVGPRASCDSLLCCALQHNRGELTLSRF
jgi:hypothetical protein